jgi:hypothetical protein
MDGMGNDLVVCGACGVINQEATDRLRQVEQDLENINGDLCGKRRRISILNGDSEFKAIHSPRYEPAMRVLGRWKTVCSPRTKSLHGKRIVNCVARLKDYDEGDLNQSVDGYARFPFVVDRRRSHVGLPAQWKADAELIFRNSSFVDQGIRLAQQEVATIPRILLEQISWRRVRELNRQLIVRYLTEQFSRPFQDGNSLYSPCPRCDDGSRVSAPLRMTLMDIGGSMAECSRCGLTEEHLLQMASRRRRRSSDINVQLELADA